MESGFPFGDDDGKFLNGNGVDGYLSSSDVQKFRRHNLKQI
jgi:hypothetical protein